MGGLKEKFNILCQNIQAERKMSVPDWKQVYIGNLRDTIVGS